MDLRHRHTGHATAQLPAQLGDVAADGGLAQLGAVLVDQPLPDPPGGVPLLLGKHLVGGHPGADQWLPRANTGAARSDASAPAAPHSSAPGGPSAVNAAFARQRPHAHPFQTGITADTLEQLHPRHRFSLAPLAW
jgi:hypothetical protein